MKRLNITLSAIVLALSASGCAPSSSAENPASKAPSDSSKTPYDPGIFTFAPQEGSQYQHTMHRREEVAIIGTPMRNIEEWEVTWNITVKKETNLSVLEAKLASLKVTVNDALILDGSDLSGGVAYMQLLFDNKGYVVDIRRTETVTEAIADLATPEARPLLTRLFSPQNLRMLFLARANERIRDLVGRSARVGEIWGARSDADAQGPVVKTLSVRGIEACDEEQCVRIDREMTVDRAMVWEGARGRVTEYVKQQGGDPELVKLTDAQVELKDEILVNPHNMRFHGASFSQKASLSVEGPKGNLSVTFSTLRESTYKY